VTTLPSPYALDNGDDWAAAHHSLLAQLFDSESQRQALRHGSLADKRCLEVGVGVGGRFALWLAEQVGEAGNVLAIDLEPRDIPVHERLTVEAQDITSYPLDSAWDFIHARLVLRHIPERVAVLHKLVEALAPGGMILVEEFYLMPEYMVVAAPTQDARQLYMDVQRLLTYRGFENVDPVWAREVHRALRAYGLNLVHTDIHSEIWEGGGLGCELVAGTIQQLRPKLLATGKVTAEHLDEVLELLDDEAFVLAGHPMYSTSGRKPE